MDKFEEFVWNNVSARDLCNLKRSGLFGDFEEVRRKEFTSEDWKIMESYTEEVFRECMRGFGSAENTERLIRAAKECGIAFKES